VTNKPDHDDLDRSMQNQEIKNQKTDHGDLIRSQPAPDTTGIEDQEQQLDKARKSYDLGVAGDKKAVAEAYQLFKKLHLENPQNSDIEAYYGGVTCLLGRDEINPIERFNKVREGLKILDRVVRNFPDNIQARMLRSRVCARLPEMYFHRTATAIEDFNHLVSLYEKDNSTFPPETYRQLLYDLDEARKSLGRTPKANSAPAKLPAEVAKPKHREPIEREESKKPQAASPPPAVGYILPAPQNIPCPKDLLQEGITLHDQALNDDHGATLKAFEFFSKIYQDYTEDPLVAAYYADCLSMAGRQSADPAAVFGHPFRAIKILDNAASSDPDNLQIRLIRACNSFRLPEGFFQRGAAAIADFEYIIRRCDQDQTALPPDTCWQIRYDCGVAYKRLGLPEEAEAVWEKLLSANPDPKYQIMVSQQKGAGLIEDTETPFSPDSNQDELREGIRLHTLALAGDREAAKTAHNLLKKALESNPDSPLALAYYGSSMALLAQESGDPATMFSSIFKGLKMIKQALAREWNNPRIRLLRAQLAFSLPGYFNLNPMAVEDFNFIKESYEKDRGIIPQEEYWQVLYNLGLAHRRAGNQEEAEKVWSLLQTESADPKYQGLVNPVNL